MLFLQDHQSDSAGDQFSERHGQLALLALIFGTIVHGHMHNLVQYPRQIRLTFATAIGDLGTRTGPPQQRSGQQHEVMWYFAMRSGNTLAGLANWMMCRLISSASPTAPPACGSPDQT